MEEQKTLGQIAFEAYAASRNNLDFKGDPLPPWLQISVGVRDGWEVAASAVVEETVKTQDTWELTRQYYFHLTAIKPNDRTELDRRIQIAITKFEDIIPIFGFWLAGGMDNKE